MEPKNHPLQKGTSSSSHHVSPVPAVNLPGCFRFLLDDDFHPYQKDLLVSDADGEKKTSKKSHPQSARNLTPVSELLFHPWLARWSMFQVSQWWLLQLHSSPSNCATRWDVTGKLDGFPWVFHPTKIGVKTMGFPPKKSLGKLPRFFFDLERLERLLICWFLACLGACWVKDEAILGGGFKDFLFSSLLGEDSQFD